MEFIKTIKQSNKIITFSQEIQKPLFLKCVLSVLVLNELTCTLLDLTGDICLYNRFTKSCAKMMLGINMICVRQVYIPYAYTTSTPATYKIQ